MSVREPFVLCREGGTAASEAQDTSDQVFLMHWDISFARPLIWRECFIRARFHCGSPVP